MKLVDLRKGISQKDNNRKEILERELRSLSYPHSPFPY